MSHKTVVNQAELDAMGPEDDFAIDFGAADARLRRGRNVRVISCRDLDASGAKIGGNLFVASGAKIDSVRIGEPTEGDIRFLESIDIDRLSMSYWHGDRWNPDAEGDCGTTHCLAGWMQALSTDPAVRHMTPLQAGKLLHPNLSYLFFVGDEIARKEIARILSKRA